MISKKKCCCESVGCLSTLGCKWPAKDLVFSWTANARHSAGSTPMLFLNGGGVGGWVGWYGVIDSAFPPYGSPSWGPAILDGDVGSCTATYGGTTAKILVLLACNGGSLAASCGRRRIGSGASFVTALEPGVVVIPGVGAPYLGAAFDWSSCPSGSPVVSEYGTPTASLSSQACDPLSIAISFALGFNRPDAGTYLMPYSGVITR